MVLTNTANSFIECVAQVLNNSTELIQVLKIINVGGIT